MKDLHRLAIELGGDAVSAAMGQAEAMSAQNSADPMAMAYKGSLLTIIGDELINSERRREYVLTGLALMLDSLKQNTGGRPINTELNYVIATSIAALPESYGCRAQALERLHALISDRDFATLDAFQQLRALTLCSCVEQAIGDAGTAAELFGRAKQTNEGLAIRLCCAWLEMEK